jgi:hypothetical protein
VARAPTGGESGARGLPGRDRPCIVQAMNGIFICYRREDTGGDAGRLYDRLRAHFGAGCVFRDVDTIRPGVQFPQEIDQRLAGCRVLLALIGPRWLSAVDAEGRPRIHARGDYVRQEIATAFARDVDVIPVLFQNVRMPEEDDLPSDLRPLASCQAVEVRDANFHDDVTRLIATLDATVPPVGALEVLRRRWRRYLPRAALLAGALLGGVLLVRAAATPHPAAEGPSELAERPLSEELGDRAGEALPDPPGAASQPGEPVGGTPPPAVSAPPPTRVSLRSEPATLTPDEVRNAILVHDFFSSRTNPAGTGIARDYRREIVQGVAVVVDEVTGLMWEHRGSGQLVGGGWSGAAERVDRLNQERVGGFVDWRLPTIEEALALMVPPGTGGFHISPSFDASGAPFVWTTDGEREGRGWVIYYLDGFAAVEDHGFNAYVRAVRSR